MHNILQAVFSWVSIASCAIDVKSYCFEKWYQQAEFKFQANLLHPLGKGMKPYLLPPAGLTGSSSFGYAASLVKTSIVGKKSWNPRKVILICIKNRSVDIPRWQRNYKYETKEKVDVKGIKEMRRIIKNSCHTSMYLFSTYVNRNVFFVKLLFCCIFSPFCLSSPEK